MKDSVILLPLPLRQYFSKTKKWEVSTGTKPLPSSKNAHFQNEAKCTIFLVKMSFKKDLEKNKNFYDNSWNPKGLVLFFLLFSSNNRCMHN